MVIARLDVIYVSGARKDTQETQGFFWSTHNSIGSTFLPFIQLFSQSAFHLVNIYYLLHIQLYAKHWEILKSIHYNLVRSKIPTQGETKQQNRVPRQHGIVGKKSKNWKQKESHMQNKKTMPNEESNETAETYL